MLSDRTAAARRRLAPRTAIRGGGPSDDKGGPGDSPVSVRWLRDLERGGGRPSRQSAAAPISPGHAHGHSLPPPTVEGRRIDPESGMFEPMPVGAGDPGDAARSPASSPRARARPATAGSTVGLSDWERWLEFCARLDGFPRHLSIH